MVPDDAPEPTEDSLEIPTRYLSLARRQWEDDRKLNAIFESIYRASYPVENLRDRTFLYLQPGPFRHRYWRTAAFIPVADRDSTAEQTDLDWNPRNPRLPLPDASIDLCYCNGSIELTTDQEAIVHFKEIHRTLKRGGVARFVFFDAALGVRALRRGDHRFFIDEDKLPLSYRLLARCTLVARDDNPFHVSPREANAYFSRFSDPFLALSDAAEKSDLTLHARVGGAINWYSPPKVTRLLRRAGFERLYPSSYRQSIVPVMRDGRLFDRTDPSTAGYIDALKI